MSSEIEVNLNDYAYVRLTPSGEKLFARYYHDLTLDPALYRAMHLQADGRWRFQLYDLMHIFGPGCMMGPIPPFETNFTVVRT